MDPYRKSPLMRLKATNLLAFGGTTPFTESPAIHREIQESVKAQTIHPAHHMAEGWVSTTALEQAPRRFGWPGGKKKLAQTLSAFNVDTRGLRGGRLEWTADNHYRKTTYYKVYRWDAGKGAIVGTGDWTPLDVG